MEYAPKLEQSTTDTDPISIAEYEDLIAEHKQLVIQLSAAEKSTLPEMVMAGIRERMTDVERYITEYESARDAKGVFTTPPETTDQDPQSELDLVVDHAEMDESRFTGPGSDSPAFLRQE